MRELQIGGAGARRQDRHPHLDENLFLTDRGRHEPLEPVVHLHRATALGPLADHLGAEGDHRRRVVRRGVGVGK
jgi:hypothetical protein